MNLNPLLETILSWTPCGPFKT